MARKNRKRGKGKTARKARAGQVADQDEDFQKAPHSFVFHRGHVGKTVGHLITDMRRVMEPYTATHLKVRKKNVLKDFVSVAASLNVTHFMMFTKTDLAPYMRILRSPRGPTMTFKVHRYSLSRDIVSSLKRHHMEAKQFNHHPLLVMNNFSGEGMQLKLMATMFQNMFPSINVNKVKLNDMKRCVILNYNADTKIIDFRHYNIHIVPVGMSRGVRKLVKAKLPDLSKYKDVSEYLIKDGNLSESEAELDGPHNEVILPQDVNSRGNIKASKSAIRLTEIGPRLSLQLVKIEEGLCEGDVLFHELVQKSKEEVQAMKDYRNKKRVLRDKRKQQQEDNVKRKEEKKHGLKEKSLEGIRRKQDKEQQQEEVKGDKVVETEEVQGEEVEQPGGSGGDESSDMEDSEYFKQEVGEEPEPELFPSSNKSKMGTKRRKRPDSGPPKKRQREEDPRGWKNKKNKNKDLVPAKGKGKQLSKHNMKGGKIMGKTKPDGGQKFRDSEKWTKGKNAGKNVPKHQKFGNKKKGAASHGKRKGGNFKGISSKFRQGKK